jgi:hypothetical protein
MPLILRSTKGSPLTFNELDGNFTYLSESIASGSGGGTPATASYALTAETAATASYFSGSTSLIGSLTATPTGVIITGSLIVSGSNTLNNVGPLTTGDINNIAHSNSMAQGEETSATGNYSHAEGIGNATGNYSHAEGGGSANGDYSHAEGGGRANGDYSHAEGINTYTGLHSWPTRQIIDGPGTVTINLSSSAGDVSSDLLTIGTAILLEREVIALSAFDIYDKAITRHIVSSSTFNGTVTQIVVTPQIVGAIVNSPCKVSIQSQLLDPGTPLTNQTVILGGGAAHSEGQYSVAVGNFSNATGRGTVALGQGQFVTGTYNTLSDTGSLLIVGRGTEGVRRDAFKVNPIGSITVPTTRSAAPNWTGTDGEMIFATVSGNHRFYVWMSGAWRSGSLF